MLVNCSRRSSFAALTKLSCCSCSTLKTEPDSSKWKWLLGFSALGASAGLLYYQNKPASINNAISVQSTSELKVPIAKVENTPANPVVIITADQMREMVEKDNRVVVSFKGSVYDVTDFTGHPGGYGRLQMAAGNDLEVFWKVYTQHNRGHIDTILSRYKIGELTPEDTEKIRATSVFSNPYSNDPPPSPHLLTNTRFPYNAEAKITDLRESWITPIGKHFVRNHSTVPDINPEEYRLHVSGMYR